MKRILSLSALLLCSVLTWGQTVLSGVVVDAETQQRIPFAGVTINDENTGITTNAEGEFRISTSLDVRFLSVRAFGYEKRKFIIGNQSSNLVIALNTAETMLTEVAVIAGENPLHRIIRKVIANRDNNNPTALDAFKYETYSKVLFTILGDTTGPAIDTIFHIVDSSDLDLAVNRDSIVRIDSSTYHRRQFMKTQHLFIMESITERTYVDPRDNEKVLATEIAGLQTPLFALIATEMQSFSFYDNYIRILGSDRVNPVAPGAIGRYVYLPSDTILDGTDTTFVIEYYPVKGHRFKGLDGELYITTDGWAVKKVIARPTGQDILGIVTGPSTVFGVEIHQTYEKVSDHWFPKELSLDFRQFETQEDGSSAAVSVQTGDDETLYGFGKTEIKNIQINPDIRTSEVDRISVAIEPDAGEKSEEFWNSYRGDSLDAREKRTYEVVDSISEEFDVERKLKWLMALSTGKIRWGYFDINIDKLLRYNVYEGFRLGLGAQTSPKLSEWFSIGGNVAYGFKDKVWKYGYFGEIYLNKSTESTLYGGYEFDIYEAAGTRFRLQRSTIFGDADYHFLNIPTFDEVSDAYFGIRHRIWPNWRVDLSVHRQNRFSTGAYSHIHESDPNVSINGYNLGFARLEMEYAPHDRYVSGPFGLRSLEKTYPRFRFAYEESIDDLFDVNYPYRRVDAQAIHQIRRVYLGTTTFSLMGSYIDGDVPYGILAGPESNASGGFSWRNFTNAIASFRSFETMPFNKYATNAYVHFDFRHSFEDRLFNIGTWAPGVDVVYRTAWGTLDHPESHVGFDLEGLDKVYHEAGIEVNRMWEGIGIGFYQRFGPYYSGEYSDNISVKLTYRLSLF